MIRAGTKGVSEAAVIGIPPTTSTRARMERERVEKEGQTTPNTRATGNTSPGSTGLIQRPLSAREKASLGRDRKELVAERQREAAEYYRRKHEQEQAQKQADRRKPEYEEKLQQREAQKAWMAEAVRQWQAEMVAEQHPVPAETQAPAPEPAIVNPEPQNKEAWLTAHDDFALEFPQVTLLQLLDLIDVIKANPQLDPRKRETWREIYLRYFGNGKSER